jgi:tRNA G10  N-methylase Trm11
MYISVVRYKELGILHVSGLLIFIYLQLRTHSQSHTRLKYTVTYTYRKWSHTTLTRSTHICDDLALAPFPL